MKNKNDTEILKRLILECRDVIHACTDIMMEGIDRIDPETGKTYRQHLEVELGSVQAIIGLLVENRTVLPNQLAVNELKHLKRMESRYDLS